MADFDIHKEMTDEELEAHFDAIVEKVGAIRNAKAIASVVYEDGVIVQAKYEPPVDLDFDITDGSLGLRR